MKILSTLKKLLIRLLVRSAVSSAKEANLHLCFCNQGLASDGGAHILAYQALQKTRAALAEALRIASS